MADANSTALNYSINDVRDTLSEARAVATFVQGITLVSGPVRDLHLSAGQTTGLYYTMQDLIDRISRAEGMLEQLNSPKKPETTARTAEMEGAQS